MTNPETKLGSAVMLQTSFSKALAQTIEALKTEGFGVLTEIDVQATMRKKLGVDLPEQRILGACNPHLAFRALSAAPRVGLLLPCNVTVRQADERTVEVSIVDPLVMLGVASEPGLRPVAEEAAAKLERVRAKLAESA